MRPRCTRRQFLARSAGLAGALWLSQVVPVAATDRPSGARPLILVHGFNEVAGVWYLPDNALAARLLQAGYHWASSSLIPFAFPERQDQPGREDSQGDITVVGESLIEAIRTTAARSADGQVDLLGFSMGGLASRWAIAELRERERGSKPLVNTAILVATPSNGADILVWFSSLGSGGRRLVDDLALELFDLDLRGTGARQMLPDSEFLQDLNRSGRSDSRVRYVLIAGDARLRQRFGPLQLEADLGDGMVSLGSASHLPGAGAQLYTLPDRLDGTSQAPWELIQQSPVNHLRLYANDDVALAAATELSRDAAALRVEFATRLENAVQVSTI